MEKMNEHTQMIRDSLKYLLMTYPTVLITLLYCDKEEMYNKLREDITRAAAQPIQIELIVQEIRELKETYTKERNKKDVSHNEN